MAERNDSQLLIEGPKAAVSADTPIIELEPLHATTGAGATAEKAGSPDTAAPEQGSRWRLPAYAPMAAAIVFALALGAVAGAAATSSLMREPAPAAVAGDATRALQNSVAQLGSELAALKAGIANAQRSTGTQFGKLAERLDRAEKAQAEPVSKLAKLQESIDRLEHRPQQAAVAAPGSDVTGSVTPKEESRPQVAEGWRLRDFYDGRAVVEDRHRTLFRIGPGSNVPGLGRVETIKRENGRVVVVTASGIIAATLEQRRPSGYYRW